MSRQRRLAPTRAEYQSKFAQANRLVNQWRQEVESMGKEDTDRLLHINSLQEYRDLWPTLMNDMLAVVPTAPLDQLKQVKRDQRRQIVIDSITSRYAPDIRAPIAASGADFIKFVGRDISLQDVQQPQQQFFNDSVMRGGYYGRGRFAEEDGRYRGPGGGYGGPGGGYGGGYGGYGGGYVAMEESGFEGDMTPGADGKLAANTPRGYIVTIRGTTPNKGKGGFVDSAFLQKLLEYTAEQQLKLGRSWYVARAEIVQVGPRNIKNQPQADEFEETAELGGEIVQLDKSGKPIFDPKRDRLFPEEVITADTEFVVLAVITLDPANAPPDPNKKPATP
jgi:hypothetical protein